MASPAGYKITIGVTDLVTKPIEAINKRLQAIHAPIQRMQKSLSKFSDLSGLTAVSNGFSAIGRGAGKVLSTLSTMLPVFGSLVGAASIAGVYKLAEGWAELGNKMLNMGSVLGVAPARLQTLGEAARLAGASAGDMESSISGLNQALQGAVSGKNREAAALFQSYGIDIQKSGYQAKSGAEKLGDAFEVIKRLKEGGASAATVQNAMGILGLSSNLTRFAEQGRAGLEAYTQEAKHFGYQSNESATAAGDMWHAIGQVTIAVDGLTNAIAEKLGPVITPLLTQMAEWIATNRDLIATGIQEYVQKFAKFVGEIDWAGGIKGIKEFASEVNDLVQSIGGWQVAAEGLFALWALPKLLGIASAIGKIGLALSSGPVLLALAAWGAYYAAANKWKVDSVADVDKQFAGLAPNSPLWNNTPDELQERYANSPLNQHRTGEDRSFAQRTIDSFRGGDGKADPKLDDKAKQAFDFWKGQGFSDHAAAGMVANEERESGFNPAARGDNGAAGGLFQWHQDRRDEMFKGTGIDVYTEKDPNKQRLAAAWEMTYGSEKKAGDAIRGAATGRLAGALGSLKYERPANAEGEAIKRGDIAAQREKQFGAPDAPATADTQKPPPAPSINAPVAAKPASASGSVNITIGNNTGHQVVADARGSIFRGPPRISQPMTGLT